MINENKARPDILKERQTTPEFFYNVEKINKDHEEIAKGNEEEYESILSSSAKTIEDINYPKSKNQPTTRPEDFKKISLDESLFNDYKTTGNYIVEGYFDENYKFLADKCEFKNKKDAAYCAWDFLSSSRESVIVSLPNNRKVKYTPSMCENFKTGQKEKFYRLLE